MGSKTRTGSHTLGIVVNAARPYPMLLWCGLATLTSPALAQPRASNLGQVSDDNPSGVGVEQGTARDRCGGGGLRDHEGRHPALWHDLGPDLLRLAPGVNVAQNQRKKVGDLPARFNELYAHILLVLVDGRTVDSRLFSGVLWDAEHLILNDINPIEVIRGPSAALWGANAMNAVINIVTSSSAEMQGALVRLEAGGAGEQAAVRYGGALGASSHRVHAQWTRRGRLTDRTGISANDASQRVTAGFRADRSTRRDTFLLEGFIEDLPARLASIDDAVTAGSASALHTSAHELKGAAATLAAGGLAHAASVLEEIGADARMNAAVAAFDQLSLEAGRVIDVLPRFVSSIKQPAPRAS
jgi:hypothetical protein